MLQNLIAIYITGWVIALILLVVITIPIVIKRCRINNLYRFDRHINSFKIGMDINAKSYNNEKLVDDKKSRAIKLYGNKGILIRVIPYDGVAIDLTSERKRHSNNYGYGCGGSGGSGTYTIYNRNSLDTKFVESYLKGLKYYYPSSENLFNADNRFDVAPNDDESYETYIDYFFSIDVIINFVSKEWWERYKNLLTSPHYKKDYNNAYFYVVNDMGKFYDSGYYLYNEELRYIGGDNLLQLIRTCGVAGIPFDCDMSDIIESKRRRNYKIFKIANFYFRNEDE